jgi:DNA-binding NtrC family response regulator
MEGTMDEPSAGLVLVVEDDAELRRIMRATLAEAGCSVLEARDAYEGLFACAQCGNALRLLITEINLLPVGGIKLAENALRLWPRIQVLCTSSDAEPRGVHHWMRYLSAEFLPKPFSPQQLQSAAFRMLAKREQDYPESATEAAAWTAAAPIRVQPMPARSHTVRSAATHAPASRNQKFWLKEF